MNTAIFKNAMQVISILIGASITGQLANINNNISQCKMIFLDTNKALIYKNQCINDGALIIPK